MPGEKPMELCGERVDRGYLFSRIRILVFLLLTLFPRW